MILDHATLVVASLALLVSIAAAWSSYRSASAARESAEAAQLTARTDLERDHHGNRPQPNGDFHFEKDRTDAKRLLIYEFQLTAEYEMAAQVAGANGQPVSLREVSPAATPNVYRVFVERWPERDDDPWPYRELIVKFWPPDPANGHPATWTCECGRETRSAGMAGHWHWRIPINPPVAPKSNIW